MATTTRQRRIPGNLALIAALVLLCAQTVAQVHDHGQVLDAPCVACAASTASLPEAPILPIPVRQPRSILGVGIVLPVLPAGIPHAHPRAPPIR